MSDKQEADKNETLLPHLLNPHKIKIKKSRQLKKYKTTFIEKQKENPMP
jgi:hypothetical protein